jgi:hypothetical protein
MSSFFQLFMAWGLLVVFVLVLYVVDKVNVIYTGYSQPELPKTYNDGLFGELSGKTLWDAMSGIPVPGSDANLVNSLKPHYEPVLRQHIEQVFMEGYTHGRSGTAGVPTNNRIIPTPRGSLESWLPMHHLASIYQAGVDFAAQNPEDALRIQQSLDQVTWFRSQGGLLRHTFDLPRGRLGTDNVAPVRFRSAVGTDDGPHSNGDRNGTSSGTCRASGDANSSAVDT